MWSQRNQKNTFFTILKKFSQIAKFSQKNVGTLLAHLVVK